MEKMVKIEFSCENAAFDGWPAGEAARILRAIASTIENSVYESASFRVSDVNGNKIGSASFNFEKEEENQSD